MQRRPGRAADGPGADGVGPDLRPVAGLRSAADTAERAKFAVDLVAHTR
jgi:hypothetical protein